MTVAVPASRNAPCPCGSGKRYKDCHGALRVTAPAPGAQAPLADAAGSRRAAMLQEALALQQAGDLAAAMVAYERVLADAPDDFDALHMLGVVHYQRHAFDRAEALLRAALARNPGVVAAQQNLALLTEARRLEAAEDALCREVLPRLAPLCEDPSAFGTLFAARPSIDLLDGAVVASSDPLFARLAGGALGPASVHAPVPEPVLGRPVVPPQGMLAQAVTMLYGVAMPLAAFARVRADALRVLVVDRDAPSALHDRLRELSDEGRCRVHLRFATSALERVLALPGGTIDVAPQVAS